MAEKVGKVLNGEGLEAERICLRKRRKVKRDKW